MAIIYGPVPSWRLGRSLGIDMVSTDAKTCSFDCIYCQLGKTINRQSSRKDFVNTDTLKEELDNLPEMEMDYLTFSGVGEPTLASNLGTAIEMAREKFHIPVAVLTNSSLLHEKDVRQALARADTVVAKLDAPDDTLLGIVNNPVFHLSARKLIEGIKSFRSIFPGKLAIQIMLLDQNRKQAPQLAELVKTLAPDEVQINTPLRPCPVRPLSRPVLLQTSRCFSGLKNVINVYQEHKPATMPLNRQQMERRRPSGKQQ